MTRHPRRTAQPGDRGAATVELALLLPMLIGLSGVVISVALGFATQALVQRAAEATARAAAVPEDFDARTYRDDAELETVARDAALLLTGVTVDAVDCDRSPCGEGATLRVTARYRWDNPAARVFGMLRGAGAGGTYDFVSTAERVRE